MRCLKSRSTLIRERIEYWENKKKHLTYSLGLFKNKESYPYYFGKERQMIANEVHSINRLIDRMYNLLKKK